MSRTRRAAIVAAVLVLASGSIAACAADGVTYRNAPAGTDEDAAADANVPEDARAAADAGGDSATPVPPCSVDGWCYTTLPSTSSFDAGTTPPDPDGFVFPMQSVWVAPDHHAYAVTSAGHLLHWNGTTWTVDLVARAGLRSVWGASATDVWLAGDSGLVLHGTGTAGALTFQPVAFASTQGLTHIWGTSPTDVWLLADRVYHLDAESVKTATPFVPVDVPSSFGAAADTMRITAVWGTATETWFGGNESSFCAPPSCTTASQRFVARRRVAAGAPSWSTVALPIDAASGISAGVTTSDGLQVLTLRGGPFTQTGLAVRIADDASKLDPKRGPITVAGAHAWSFEVADAYGFPEGLWGRDSRDLWLVGESGVVRHFDGAAWQISRVARTKLSPLVNDLHGIDAVVDATGTRDMWVVGDDVALHRTVKP